MPARPGNKKIKILKFHSTAIRQRVPVRIILLTCRHHAVIAYQRSTNLFSPETALGVTRYLHENSFLFETSIFALEKSQKKKRHCWKNYNKEFLLEMHNFIRFYLFKNKYLPKTYTSKIIAI